MPNVSLTSNVPTKPFLDSGYGLVLDPRNCPMQRERWRSDVRTLSNICVLDVRLCLPTPSRLLY